MARAIAVLGTASDVGKSVVAAGLCRLFHRRGVRVAPFKAQNMSLNSFVTVEGGEIGRAQALQAEACGVIPHVDMNPILLKPETNQRSQVIVQGKVWQSREAVEYFGCQQELVRSVRESYERLASQYEVVVIEGAGSAAEMNLRDHDLVNWPMVDFANASVILVADIDRGGVFAQVIGTLDLLAPEERRRVMGVVINKFRGDLRLFAGGVRFLENRTNVPVLGVLPFMRNVELDQEDSVSVKESSQTPFGPHTVNVAVVLLPHMSNFTDFNALAAEEDVVLRYVTAPVELTEADVVILPGSKTTIADLEYVRKKGFEKPLHHHVEQGKELVGMCGGFQMLGQEISDPFMVETGGSTKGLGLLAIRTELQRDKQTLQVVATPLHVEEALDVRVTGYEIHMGVTTCIGSGRPCFGILERRGRSHQDAQGDGIWERNGLVWGTYIHGVFDQHQFRRIWLNRIRKRKGLPPLEETVSEVVSDRLESALDRWADHVQKHVNLDPLYAIVDIR